MRRLSAVATSLLPGLLLSACIPHVDRPYPSAPPPRRADYPPPRPQQPPPQRPQPQPQPQSQPQSQPQPRSPVQQLPAPRPAWETRGADADARDVPAQSYVVRPGDTLSEVADRTGAGLTVIVGANGIDPPYTIRAGQRLTIPAGRYHLVRQGQTGIAIARAYGVEWSRIVSANYLSEPYVLRTGQRILIPGSSARGSSAAERAAAFKLDIDDIITGGEPAIAQNQRPAAPTASPRRVLPPSAAVAAPRIPPGRFMWPVDGQVVKHFGIGASGERNDGVEIGVPHNTPVRATADGTGAYAGDASAALGGLVIVKHGEGWTSVYGHASKLLVQRGQAVKKGQTIALSGASGFADRPELHFELRKGRTPIDPLTQLPR